MPGQLSSSSSQAAFSAAISFARASLVSSHASDLSAMRRISAVALALLLVVAVGEVSPERQFGLYLTAVLLLFLMSALFFLRLLATSFRGDDSNSD